MFQCYWRFVKHASILSILERLQQGSAVFQYYSKRKIDVSYFSGGRPLVGGFVIFFCLQNLIVGQPNPNDPYTKTVIFSYTRDGQPPFVVRNRTTHTYMSDTDTNGTVRP